MGASIDKETNIRYQIKWLCYSSAVCALVVIQSAFADTITILPIGDSLTTGKASAPSGPRASYRPYLWQSIDNYLRSVDSSLTVDFVGSNHHVARTPSGIEESRIGYNELNPNAVNPEWDKDHFATAGFASMSFEGSTVTDEINDNIRTTVDIALILLGTNDLVRGNVGSGNPLAEGTTTLGNIKDVVSQLQAHNADIEVIIGAVPPVADRDSMDPTKARYDGDYNWDEGSRRQDLVEWDGSRYRMAGPANVSNPSLNNYGGGTATSNDVVQALNDALEKYAAVTHGVRFVDPKHSGLMLYDYPTQGTVAIDPLDPTRADDSFGDDINPDYIDGLHLNFGGDQKYAAAFFAGILDVIQYHSGPVPAAAQAVPEPGGFTYLGLTIVLGAIAGRYRQRSGRRLL